MTSSIILLFHRPDPVNQIAKIGLEPLLWFWAMLLLLLLSRWWLVLAEMLLLRSKYKCGEDCPARLAPHLTHYLSLSQPGRLFTSTSHSHLTVMWGSGCGLGAGGPHLPSHTLRKYHMEIITCKRIEIEMCVLSVFMNIAGRKRKILSFGNILKYLHFCVL